MPLHPAPPEDLSGLADAFGHTVQSVIDLGTALHTEDFEKPTACPGWTVKDQISHVVGLEAWIASGEDPAVKVPDYPYLRHDLARFMEMHVEVRRRVPGPEVVAELISLLPERLAFYRDPSLTPDTLIRSPWGLAPAGRVLRNRTMDVWVHEQDLREALGRPGDLDSAAASVFVDFFFDALPRLVAKDAAVPPGNVVVFAITGPVIGRAGVRVEADAEGAAVGTALFSGVDHETQDHHESTTTITMSTQALGRRAAGRGTTEDVHVSVHGDEDIARQVLQAIPFTP